MAVMVKAIECVNFNWSVSWRKQKEPERDADGDTVGPSAFGLVGLVLVWTGVSDSFGFFFPQFLFNFMSIWTLRPLFSSPLI